MAPRILQSAQPSEQRHSTPSGSHLHANSQTPSEQQLQSNSSMPVEGSPGAETNESNARKGRGPALGVKKWGKAGYKMHLTFNEHMQVCGENSKAFATRLGMIAKCGVKAPLKPKDWRKVSEKRKDAIWKEIQDNTDAPDEFKKLCLRRVGDIWRSWKFKVKKKFFTPNKNNPAALAIPPSDTRVKPTSWTKLVEHWKREDVQEDAERNKENRGQSEFPHRTGRTAFADIRLEMMEKGEDISRQNVFRRTRLKKNGGHAEEVEAALEQMNRKLDEVPESEHTPELIDEVFTQVMGPDGHGRVRTFGLGPTPTTFGSNSSSSGASSDRIQKLVDTKVDAKLKEAELIRKEEECIRKEEMAAEIAAQVELIRKEEERIRKEEMAAEIAAQVELIRKEEERIRKEEIAAQVAAQIKYQLQAHGIVQPSDTRVRGSLRIPSSGGQD